MVTVCHIKLTLDRAVREDITIRTPLHRQCIVSVVYFISMRTPELVRWSKVVVGGGSEISR